MTSLKLSNTASWVLAISLLSVAQIASAGDGIPNTTHESASTAAAQAKEKRQGDRDQILTELMLSRDDVAKLRTSLLDSSISDAARAEIKGNIREREDDIKDLKSQLQDLDQTAKNCPDCSRQIGDQMGLVLPLSKLAAKGIKLRGLAELEAERKFLNTEIQSSEKDILDLIVSSQDKATPKSQLVQINVALTKERKAVKELKNALSETEDSIMDLSDSCRNCKAAAGETVGAMLIREQQELERLKQTGLEMQPADERLYDSLLADRVHQGITTAPPSVEKLLNSGSKGN